MPKGLPYYKERVLALRNALSVLLEEMDKEIVPSSKPRRSSKQSLLKELNENAALGTWRKPKALKKNRA